MILNPSQINALETFADENDLEFRSDYSGRLMYGKTCVGLVGPSIIHMAMKFQKFISNSMPEIETHVKQSRQDNMGRYYILYFPNLVAKEE